MVLRDCNVVGGLVPSEDSLAYVTSSPNHGYVARPYLKK